MEEMQEQPNQVTEDPGIGELIEKKNQLQVFSTALL